MSDPFEIVTTAIAEDNFSAEHAAETALAALRADGWRLVRVADAWPADNGGICMLVDEEWKPASGVAAPEGDDRG